MINDELKNEMLKSISLTGAADEKSGVVKPIISGHISHVLNLSSGLPRLQTNTVKRFSLVLSTPQALQALSPFEIRCCLCKSVIRYPAWYYSMKYAVNHFHYFVCFDSGSADKPTVKCYKRG